MVEYYEARVLFDYTPVAADELHLRRGESIEVRVGGEEDESWLYGSDQRGCHGVFPANYVVDIRTSTSTPATFRVKNDTDNDNGGGGGGDSGDNVPSAVPSQSPGDTATHAGDFVGTSTAAHDGQAGAVVEHNNPEGVIAAVAGYHEHWKRRDDPAGAPGFPSEERKASSAYYTGKEGAAYIAAATTTYAHDTHAENRNTSGNTLEVDTQHKANITATTAVAVVEEGAVSGSDDLPDGWLWAIDEGSGVVYYYTADGQSSWTRPTSSAVTIEPLISSGDGDESTFDGNGNSSTASSLRSLSLSAEVSLCLPNCGVVRSLAQ